MEFPWLEIEDPMVDAVAAMLIRTPERFDVILSTKVTQDRRMTTLAAVQ